MRHAVQEVRQSTRLGVVYSDLPDIIDHCGASCHLLEAQQLHQPIGGGDLALLQLSAE